MIKGIENCSDYINCAYTNQWSPVSVEIANSQRRNELWKSHYQEIHVQEYFELIDENL